MFGQINERKNKLNDMHNQQKKNVSFESFLKMKYHFGVISIILSSIQRWSQTVFSFFSQWIFWAFAFSSSIAFDYMRSINNHVNGNKRKVESTCMAGNFLLHLSNRMKRKERNYARKNYRLSFFLAKRENKWQPFCEISNETTKKKQWTEIVDAINVHKNNWIRKPSY